MFKHLSEKNIADLQNGQAQAWEDGRLLEKCVDGREGAPTFVFYEGPPTANGRPGIHHVMARTLKDSVNRYKTMRGFRVPRKAGWDTHGLPVEIEVEKELGLFTKKDIEAYGIDRFNEKCRESVWKYEGQWREMSRRMGFLCDMDDPYITLDNDYIETEWHILKDVFDRGLIYEGHKVLPYCPRCGTGLAAHEVSQGYRMVKTNTVTALFRRKGADEYFLAWTTTPWTLASNVSLTVGADIEYAKVRVRTAAEVEQGGGKPGEIAKLHGGKAVWVAKARADEVVGKGSYEVMETVAGAALEGAEYEQLMPFVDVSEGFPGRRAFYVTVGDYVTTDDGTGIVHTAPAFGEDDALTGRRYDLPVPNPVDEDGRYTATPWKGRFVMEDGLDVDIIKWLASGGKLFSKAKVEHNYPFCWRCDTPLIYYSKPSWYIEMTKLKDELIANNGGVDWHPGFIGEKRFGNWLENVKDWAISRSRYWGMPIPIWRCPDCGGLKCVGSRKELQALAAERIPDDEDGVPDIELHRPYVDEIHIACDACGAAMSRIPDVIDCWFDSGSMPFAQHHWPFEHGQEFDDALFPADFICEGIDQTRGWFYSLMAVATLVKGRAPYRNVLVNDLILDKDGVKMSKTKGNAVDPFEQFDKFGADATRWYLLHTSPAWSPTRYDEEGVKEIAGKFFGTLRNTYYFFALYANQDGVDPRTYNSGRSGRPELDRWILSRYNRLIGDVTADMDAYDHMRAVRRIQDFVIEDLSNWYVRRARRRFWAEGLDDDKKAVYATTYEVLKGVVQLAAPMAPFITDEIYTKLTGEESVHLSLYPEADEGLIDAALEDKMGLVRDIVGLGRGIREKERIKVRQPLPAVLVDAAYRERIGDMEDLVKEELNIKGIRYESDLSEYMDFSVKPDFKVAGPKLGARMKDFAASVARADAAALIGALKEGGSVVWSISTSKVVRESTDGLDSESSCGPAQPDAKAAGRSADLSDGDEVVIEKDFISARVEAKEGFAVAMEGGVSAILDTTLTPELVREGLMREFVSKVQQLRKQAGLEMMDNIDVRYGGDADVAAAVDEYRDYIMKETLARSLTELADSYPAEYDLNGHKTGMDIAKV